MRVSLVLMVFAAVGLVACGDDEPAPMGEGSTSGTSAGPTSSTSEVGSSGPASSSTGSVDPDSSGAAESSSTGPGFVPIDCTEACGDLASETGTAMCYACRCKNAMDGWLPSVEELQCSEAEVLPLYDVDESGPQPQLVESATDLDTCANPDLLYNTCRVGSKLGQLQQGDVYVKWVCRNPVDGVYDDMGAILYNARTGATCWFDDVDYVTTDDNVPDLDLMEAGVDNLTGFVERFYFTDGDSCSRDCHDADPFIYTPFFSGIEWQKGVHALSPYSRAALDGSLSPVGASHLVSREAAPCIGCHRIGSAAGCDFLSPDATGDYKTAVHHQAIVDAMDPASPDWSLAYWMPDGIVISSLDEWMEMYGAARDTINECCTNPGVDAGRCDWEPIPAE